MRIRNDIQSVIWAFLLLAALTGCAMSAATGRVLYQQGRSVIRIEADPDVGGMMGGKPNTHPAGLESIQLAKLLQGIGVRPEQGFLSKALSLATPAEPVFSEGELALVTPILAQGLAEAGPSERVSFILASTQPGRRSTVLSGYLLVRDPYLKFVLNDHPTIGWQDPEDPSSPKLFDLDFLREGFLLPGSEAERKGSYKARPAIHIDYKNYLRALEDRARMSRVVEPQAPAPPPPIQPSVQPPPSAEAGRAPARRLPPPLPSPKAGNPPAPAPASASVSESGDSPSVKDLQRQVKELTETNQELRATFKEMLERQAETQRELEDLRRLRQELAETKQLLADKVLELNKLQTKSNKPSKEKAPTTPAR